MLKKNDAGCDKYGKERLELAKYVRDNILQKINYEWFIENGTLLGAWRNNSFIPHDDDFDVAIPITKTEEATKIYNIINDLLIKKYKVRFVNTYATKLEIYDESYGKYILPGKKYNKCDFHYVTMDIQFYLKEDNKYRSLYYISPTILIDENILLPTNTIILENEKFNTPANIHKFLKKIYGSLKKDAIYNSDTGLYE